LPDGSFKFWNEASHNKASGVLHATDLTEGTVFAAASEGKCDSKILRYRYSSLFFGVLIGKRLAAVSKSVSLTKRSACSFSVSIHEWPTDYPFLHTSIFNHLIFRVDAHRDIHKLLVQKRHPSFNSPSGE